MTTLTVANSVLTLTCAPLGIGPVQMQGYATDDAFDTMNVKPVEAIVGVDGNMSYGFTAFLVPFKLILQADSPSIPIMDAIEEAQETVLEAFPMNISLAAHGLGKLWTFTKGVITDFKKTPQGKKLMGPQSYEITFNKMISSVV
jgi:Tail fiber protein gp32